jgi:hypothetical protein
MSCRLMAFERRRVPLRERVLVRAFGSCGRVRCDQSPIVRGAPGRQHSRRTHSDGSSRPAYAMRQIEAALRHIMADNSRNARRANAGACLLRCIGLAATAFAEPAGASLFQGETLDAVADGIAWVVLVIAPIVLIVGFWLIHILPEKIAEKRKHPQAKAIQTLCLLSLFFGGLLWPLAWLWAYSKPVFHKMAYGTDVEEHEAEGDLGKERETADVSDAERMRMKVVDREGAAAVQHHTRERA